MSDSNGYIVDENGIDLDLVKQLKEVERKRISEYVKFHPEAKYHEGCKGVWNVTEQEADFTSAYTDIACRNICISTDML